MRDPAPQPPTRRALLVEPIDDYPVALPAGAPPRRVAVLDVLPLPDDDIPFAEVVHAPPKRTSALRVPWLVCRSVFSAGEWAFGLVCLVVGLAVLAAIPVVQLLSLGYLLEVSGRIGRTAHWRDGLPRGRGLAGFGLYLGQNLGRFFGCFIGVRKAARVGAVVGGVWLLLLPLRLVSSLALSAQLIDPDGPIARRWRAGLTVLTVMTALAIVTGLYLLVVCSRGGVRGLIPRLVRRGFYAEARDGVWDFVTALRLPYYFWLGLRGFAGTMLWLVLPISLIALGRLIGQRGTNAAGGIGFLVGFAGAVQLMFVLLQLPFLQARFAAENRFRALFEWDAVVRAFARAPWAFGVACVATLLFALPLYLLKIEIVPREAAWLPGLVFIVFILPARLLTGWAYARSRRRQRPRHWLFIATSPVWTLPAVAFYVLIVFFTQYTSWNGIWSLYEQHAFLLPVPFVGL